MKKLVAILTALLIPCFAGLIILNCSNPTKFYESEYSLAYSYTFSGQMASGDTIILPLMYCDRETVPFISVQFSKVDENKRIYLDNNNISLYFTEGEDDPCQVEIVGIPQYYYYWISVMVPK